MSKHRSKIYVSYKDGSKPQNKKVVIGLPSGMSKPAFTDRDGVVIVEHESIGGATVYIDGKNVGTFSVPGETAVFI